MQMCATGNNKVNVDCVSSERIGMLIVLYACDILQELRHAFRDIQEFRNDSSSTGILSNTFFPAAFKFPMLITSVTKHRIKFLLS